MFLRSSLFFRHILGHFFPPKYNLHHICERIRSIRYQKGKLNVIKRQKYHFVTRAHGICSLPSASRDIFLWKKVLAGVLLFSFVWLRNFYIFQIKFLPTHTGFSGSCAPESATNPVEHSHLYEPTVLLQTWLALQASGDWHSSKSTKVTWYERCYDFF